MYVAPIAIQQYIKSIEFRDKSENLPALQIADFIPNQIARKIAGLRIYPNVSSLTRNIFIKSYDGNIGNRKRYGIKEVPRVN